MTMANEVKELVDLFNGYIAPYKETLRIAATTVVVLFFLYLTIITVGAAGSFVAIYRYLRAMRARRKPEPRDRLPGVGSYFRDKISGGKKGLR